MGNSRETPLSKLFGESDSYEHPICELLLSGGPAELARRYHVDHEEGYVDECHPCYSKRLKLRTMFPNLLVPDQMYGTAT